MTDVLDIFEVVNNNPGAEEEHGFEKGVCAHVEECQVWEVDANGDYY